MKRSTLLFAPDAQPGLPAPGEQTPGAIPAATPLSTEALENSIKAEFASYAASPAPPAAPAEPQPAPPDPGQEPSPEPPVEPAILPNSPDEGDELPASQDPKVAAAFVAERHKRKELKTKLEAERNAEKERADALAVELDKLKNPEGSKRVEPQPAPGADPLAAHPLIKEARAEQSKHAWNYHKASELLGKLGSNPDFVTAELKKLGVDTEGQSDEQVQEFLTTTRDGALLKHGESSGQLAALTREAERALGGKAAEYTSIAHQVMPELKDPKSAEYAEAQEARGLFAPLSRDPRLEYIIACQIEGKKVLDARFKRQVQQGPRGAAPATAQPAAVAHLPGAAASLPPATAAVDQVAALHKQFLASPNDETRTAWMKAVMASAQLRVA